MGNQEFWIANKEGKKPEYSIIAVELRKWLIKNNYAIIDNFGTSQVVKLNNNIVYVKSKIEVYNDALLYVEKYKNKLLTNCFITQGELYLITKKGILGSLPKLELKHYKDSKKTVRLFYENGIIKITKEKITIESFSKFKKVNKYIFQEQIINRKIEIKKSKKSDFENFLRLATSNKTHFYSVCSAIGYLISSYKNPSLAKAIIFTDTLSQIKNKAYGRSGKGLIIKAISKIINIVDYNGKITDLVNDRFAFQNIKVYTSLIVFQDVVKGFNFESLFPILTDEMSVERKHKEKINISYSNSPKVALTTNYTLPNNTDSFKDRKHLVVLNNFFNARNKPEQHLKRLLFDWNKKNYIRFDNFMIGCVQLFLQKSLIIYENTEHQKELLINNTSLKFINLMNEKYGKLNKSFFIKELSDELGLEIKNKSVKSRKVGKWLDYYAQNKELEIERTGSGGNVKYQLK